MSIAFRTAPDPPICIADNFAHTIVCATDRSTVEPAEFEVCEVDRFVCGFFAAFVEAAERAVAEFGEIGVGRGAFVEYFEVERVRLEILLEIGIALALRELLLLLYEARLSGMDLFFWSLGILALVAGRTLAVQFSPRRAG